MKVKTLPPYRMIFLLFFFMMINFSLWAQGRRIVHIGDSHTHGSFGEEFYDFLARNHQVSSYGLCGSTPRDWQDNNRFRANCTGAINFIGRSNVTSESLLMKRDIRTNGFDTILNHHKPDTVLISLGDGFITKSGVDKEQIELEVRNMLRSLPPSGTDCFWITPSFGEHYKTQKYLDQIIEGIRSGIESSGRRCTIIDGRDKSIHEQLSSPDFTHDGVHFKNEVARAWARSVAHKIDNDISGENTQDNCHDAMERSIPNHGTLENFQTNLSRVVEVIVPENGPIPQIMVPETPPQMRPTNADYANRNVYDYGGPDIVISPTTQLKLVENRSHNPQGLQGTQGTQGTLERHSDIVPDTLTLSTNDVAKLNYQSQVDTRELDRFLNGGIDYSLVLTQNSSKYGRVVRENASDIEGYRERYRNNQNQILREGTREGTQKEIREETREGTQEETQEEIREGTQEEIQEEIQDGRVAIDNNNYENLKRVARRAYQRGGGRACRRALDEAYQTIEPKPIWGNLSLSDRARRVQIHAESVLRQIREQSQDRASGHHRQDVDNPHYIHPLLNISVGICIPFIETKGHLNPHAVNYTFCQARMYSTAQGLGQQTRTTFNNLRNYNNGDRQGGLLPLTVAREYNHLQSDDLFRSLNNDVNLQMEVIFRYMNYELKNNDNNNLSDEARLLRAVANYDQDQQSSYVRKFRDCHRCVNRNPQDIMECYNIIK